MRDPKILFLDIETAPYVALTWKPYKVDRVPKIVQNRYVMSIGYRWSDSDTTEVLALPDWKTAYKKDRTDDSKLIKAIHKLEQEADMIVGHNVDRFDMKRIRGRYIAHKLPFPGKVPTVDTLKAVKRHAELDSHRLDDVCELLDIGSKLPHTGIEMWWACMNGDSEAWDLMRSYNEHDVSPLLDSLYHFLNDNNWIDNHPNLAAIVGRLAACTKCGKDSPWTKRGLTKSGNGPRYQVVQFTNCGHYGTMRRSEPHSSPIFK